MTRAGNYGTFTNGKKEGDTNVWFYSSNLSINTIGWLWPISLIISLIIWSIGGRKLTMVFFRNDSFDAEVKQ